MEISEKMIGSVNLVCFCGRLDSFASAEAEKILIPLAGTDKVSLVVNMEKLEYISSSGLRILLSALKTARKQQGDLRLTGLHPYVKEVFDMAGFSQLFKIFEKEEEAINSYK
ncbi:STAS domain-containing protein [Chloroflexota bacterium]